MIVWTLTVGVLAYSSNALVMMSVAALLVGLPRIRKQVTVCG